MKAEVAPGQHAPDDFVHLLEHLLVRGRGQELSRAARERRFGASLDAELTLDSQPPAPVHLAGLDALRVLALLLVLIWHYPGRQEAPAAFAALAQVGWTGVELFFVLSGFLIGGQLLTPVARGETPHVGRFYLRRALRILPAFWTVLALYLFLPEWRERELLTPAWRLLTFTQNFGLHFNAFSHAWSLCVEEHFYLVLPLGVLALRRARSGPLVMGLAGLMLLGALGRGALWLRLFSAADPEAPIWWDYDTLLYYPTYARLDGLLCGLGLALLRVFRPALWERVRRGPLATLLLALTCLAGAFWLCKDRMSLPTTVLAFPLLALGYAGLLWVMAGPSASRLCARLPGLSLLAALTYPLYLTHKMVFHAVHAALKATGHGPFSVLTVLACIPATLAAAWVLHRAVERPLLRLRERLERPASVPSTWVPIEEARRLP